MKNPFAKEPERPKPVVRDWKTKHKGKANKGEDVFKKMKREKREELVAKVQPIIHPVDTAKEKAKEIAAGRAAWIKQTARNQTSYKAWGTCPKCLEPNKPRHRCKRLSISFQDPDAARAEYQRLLKAYGLGPGKGIGRTKD